MHLGILELSDSVLTATGVKFAFEVVRDSLNFLTNPLKQLAWILALVVAVVLPTRAQQTDEVQKQIQQLKQQYEQTTRELQERIAALEQQKKRRVKPRRIHQEKKELCLL